MYILKLKIHGDRNEQRRAKDVLGSQSGVVRVDLNESKSLLRIVSGREISLDDASRAVANTRVRIEHVLEDLRAHTQTYEIAGMTCHSCEIKIEKALEGISGVSKVHADASRGRARIEWTPGAEENKKSVAQAIANAGYTLGADKGLGSTRPTLSQLVIMLVLVLMLGWVVDRLGWLRPTIGLGGTIGIGAAFVLGLVAASSSCLAVSGGVMLGVLSRYRTKFAPVIMFVGARVISYAVLGGLIGLVGKTLAPPPFVTGTITVLAALYMLVLGLQMLGRAPAWLTRMLPHMPKRIGSLALAESKSSHALLPAGLGALTFFLPCGFTQSLQLYALTTGSAVTSGLVLGSFALGTAPALLALGFASSKLKGKAGAVFFRFAGALVLMLGVWNFQNGFAIAGYPISFPSFRFGERAVAADTSVTLEDGVQTVNIRVDRSGYTPDRFTLKADTPARLTIDGPLAGQGCLGVFQIPKLGIVKRLVPGAATSVEFTPKAGEYAFSCSMGMYRGSFQAL